MYSTRTEVRAAGLHRHLERGVDMRKEPELDSVAVVSSKTMHWLAIADIMQVYSSYDFGRLAGGSGFNKDMGGLLQQQGRDVLFYQGGEPSTLVVVHRLSLI